MPLSSHGALTIVRRSACAFTVPELLLLFDQQHNDTRTSTALALGVVHAATQ
jgi:hypothetical protein